MARKKKKAEDNTQRSLNRMGVMACRCVEEEQVPDAELICLIAKHRPDVDTFKNRNLTEEGLNFIYSQLELVQPSRAADSKRLAACKEHLEQVLNTWAEQSDQARRSVSPARRRLEAIAA